MTAKLITGQFSLIFCILYSPLSLKYQLLPFLNSLALNHSQNSAKETSMVGVSSCGVQQCGMKPKSCSDAQCRAKVGAESGHPCVGVVLCKVSRKEEDNPAGTVSAWMDGVRRASAGGVWPCTQNVELDPNHRQ